MQNKIALALIAGLLAAAGPAMADLSAQVQFNIASQQLSAALLKYSAQSGVQITSPGKLIEGKSSTNVAGKLLAREALEQLLKGTNLAYDVIDSNSILIRPADRKSEVSRVTDLHLAQADQALQKVEMSQRKDEESSDATKGIPEILVKGRSSLNTDIERTEDAPQPYVVFGKEEIRRAQALNVEDFLRMRLPMNTATGGFSQNNTGTAFTQSEINLRGLGQNQTLILIDGRRVPTVTNAGIPRQPDLNGIPLSAIERIEVLPSTAGGIYGGSATGGVVNVVLRRDFRGLDATATYANTFDTDVANMRLDASAGFALEGGRTQIMIAATRSEAHDLVVGDRNFAARAIALQSKNNPANVAALTTPPLGATVNIRGVGGAALQLKPQYGGAALISSVTNQPTSFTHLPLGYAGPASDNGAALLANAGRYNLNLPGGTSGLERGLVAAPSMESASLNVRREIGSRLEAFLDLSSLGNRGSSLTGGAPNSVANLPANAPNNPFQQAIAVRFPTPGVSFPINTESTTLRGTGGLIARFPRDWMGEVSYGWSRSRLLVVNTGSFLDSVGTCVLGRGVAANVILGGGGALNSPCAAGDTRPALNVLQEGNLFPLDFTPYQLPSPNSQNGPIDTILKNSTVRLSGPVANLPGGPLVVSALFERRKEGMEDAFTLGINTTTRATTYIYWPSRAQATESVYLEARAPLVSSNNARTGIRELELQVSVRRDAYETTGSSSSGLINVTSPTSLPAQTYTTARLDSIDYTAGLRYAPLPDLALRASFGTGFLPPSVTQVATGVIVENGWSTPDPRRGNTPVYVGVPLTTLINGSPVLRPEQSESASVGLIFTPRFVPGLRLSIDYTRIEKTDEIQSPADTFLLANESQFPGRITRGPNLAGDPAGWAGPVTQLDLTLINIASTSLEAYDVQADYTLDTREHGDFRWYAVVTRQPHYKNQLLPTVSAVDRVGHTGGPLEWRGNLGLDWNKGPLSLGWNAQYFHSYRVYGALAAPLTLAQVASRELSVLNQGSATIPRQVYHDLVATYRFDAAPGFVGGLLANSEISFGIRNLFNKEPPALATTDPTSPGYSTYGDARLRRYSLSLKKSFGR